MENNHLTTVGKVEEAYLKTLGFKRRWLSDRSGYWLQKDIKHPFLHKCHISVERNIVIWAVDVINGHQTILHTMAFTKRNMDKAIKWLCAPSHPTSDTRHPTS